jgi:hypothetical protein
VRLAAGRVLLPRYGPANIHKEMERLAPKVAVGLQQKRGVAELLFVGDAADLRMPPGKGGSTTRGGGSLARSCWQSRATLRRRAGRRLRRGSS